MCFSMKTSLKDFQQTGLTSLISLENERNGGFLCDEAGLGKTIQLISLMSTTSLRTLIIVPSHLILNWLNEFSTHTDIDIAHDINVFHGKNRQWKSTPITITSYQTIVTCNIIPTFDRMILDECHYCRNAKTRIFKCISSIRSQYKWLVTATPVMNNKKDMLSYFKILGISSTPSKEEFLARTILRKKDIVLSLPKKKEITINVELNDIEREVYDRIVSFYNKRIGQQREMARGTDIPMLRKLITSFTIVLILRLRQTCNFVKCYHSINGVSLHEIAEEDLCFFCSEREANVYAKCNKNHKACSQCWDSILNTSISCPFCRTTTLSEDLVVEECKYESNDSTRKRIIHSSKIRTLIDLIKSKRITGKIIVSSQWVSMIHEISNSLLPNGIKHTIITGKDSLSSKMNKINKWKEDTNEKPNVLIVSLTACAEGLNLVEANTVVHMDLWWNKMKTLQMSERVYRIGQMRDVEIIHLKTIDTIEDRVIDLINYKEEWSNYYTSDSITPIERKVALL